MIKYFPLFELIYILFTYINFLPWDLITNEMIICLVLLGNGSILSILEVSFHCANFSLTWSSVLIVHNLFLLHQLLELLSLSVTALSYRIRWWPWSRRQLSILTTICLFFPVRSHWSELITFRPFIYHLRLVIVRPLLFSFILFHFSYYSQ